MNQELLEVQGTFRQGRGTRYQIVNIHWITEKAAKFQSNIFFIDYIKTFDCTDHKNLWKILQFNLATQSCPTLCDHMDCSMPGLPVHHPLLEFTQTHAHCVGHATSVICFSFCPQSFPAPGSFQMTQFFTSEKFLEMRITEPLTCLLRKLYAGQEAKLELDMKQ